jgi:hypothetical protein
MNRIYTALRTRFLLFLLTVLLCSSIFPANSAEEKGPRDKKAEELLSHLRKQIWEIRVNQIEYLAEEEQQQEEYDDSGKLQRRRRLLSNYYRVKLNGIDQIIECREIVSVDGKPTGDDKKLQKLLLSKDKSIQEQVNKISHQNRKYNLGYGRRETNQPFVGLRFSDSDRQAHTVFYIEPGADLQLSFREIDKATLFSGGAPFPKPEPAKGEYLFSADGKQFLGYDISLYNHKGTRLVRLAARYSRKKDGKLLPASFEEYSYHKNGQVKTRSISEYKNYCHFTVDAKIISFESIEQ